MNLPETYAAVCAKRPDLDVEELSYHNGQWLLDDTDFNQFVIMPCVAAEMMTGRWVRELPACYGLMHGVDHCGEPRWWVGSQVSFAIWEIKPTPLEALAAYYLGETNG